MSLAMKSTNAQWTVEKTGQSKDGGNEYVLREVGTGQTQEVSVDADSSAEIRKLIDDKLEMLKRLADR